MNTQVKIVENKDDQLVCTLRFDYGSPFDVKAVIKFDVKSGFNGKGYDAFFIGLTRDSVDVLIGDKSTSFDYDELPGVMVEVIESQIKLMERWGEYDLKNYLDIENIRYYVAECERD